MKANVEQSKMKFIHHPKLTIILKINGHVS